jgi:hypothetical protein
MTLAAQLVGKKIRGSAIADGQIVAAVEITSATNAGLALSSLEKQIKASSGDVLVVAVRI